MVDGTLDRTSPALPVVIASRIRRRRLLLLAMALVLLVLLVADHVSVLGAVLALAFLAAVVGAIPDETTADEPASGGTGSLPDGLLPGTRRFAQSLPDPCFILDREGTVLYANDRAVTMFGIRQGDRLPFRMRYPELLAALDRVVAGEGPQRVDFVERVPTERWFSAWFAAIDESGRSETILLAIDDQTAARATERMRTDFVANASHELRTPLASLAGFIETLRGPAREDTAARERFLGIMHEQATRMSRLINDLLSLSRVEMNAHVLPQGKVDLVGVLGHVIDTMGPVAAENEVRIEAELPSAEVIVTGDRDELVQVFDNLVENACKYGRTGERVVVRLEAPEHRGPATVSVIDFGPGIAPEHVPRLTERFYRVDADDSRRHRGTGLGLAIVKHIATRHRARLQIESTPGRGARFSIYFPDSETVHTAAKQKTANNQPVALS